MHKNVFAARALHQTPRGANSAPPDHLARLMEGHIVGGSKPAFAKIGLWQETLMNIYNLQCAGHTSTAFGVCA